MLASVCGIALFAQLPVDLRLLGLFPDNGSSTLLPLLLANAAILVFSMGVGSVAIMSMIGDVMDENELSTGLRQEGLFYASRAQAGCLGWSACP